MYLRDGDPLYSIIHPNMASYVLAHWICTNYIVYRIHKNNIWLQDPLEGRVLPASARENPQHQHPDPAAAGRQEEED